MSLIELQALFWGAARGQVTPEVLDQHFVGRGPRTGAGRMRIYNGAYFVRLEDALADTFPSTKVLLGDERFQALARRYIVEHPSKSPALERVGLCFARLLRARLPEGEQVIAEVSELEFARVSALLAPDDTTLTGPLNLSGANLDTLRFELVRSLGVSVVSTDAFRLWQHPEPFHTTEERSTERIGVAFWRRRFAVHHRSLDLTEAAALVNPQHSVSLLDLCHELAVYDDAVTRAVSMIERWRSLGFIARVDLHAAAKESLDADR